METITEFFTVLLKLVLVFGVLGIATFIGTCIILAFLKILLMPVSVYQKIKGKIQARKELMDSLKEIPSRMQDLQVQMHQLDDRSRYHNRQNHHRRDVRQEMEQLRYEISHLRELLSVSSGEIDEKIRRH